MYNKLQSCNLLRKKSEVSYIKAEAADAILKIDKIWGEEESSVFVFYSSCFALEILNIKFKRWRE